MASVFAGPCLGFNTVREQANQAMTTPRDIGASAQAAGVKAHAAGDLVTAEKLYRRALAYSELPGPDIYANYGALLREIQKPNDAISVYRRGLKQHPRETILLRNFANLCRNQRVEL